MKRPAPPHDASASLQDYARALLEYYARDEKDGMYPGAQAVMHDWADTLSVWDIVRARRVRIPTRSVLLTNIASAQALPKGSPLEVWTDFAHLRRLAETTADELEGVPTTAFSTDGTEFSFMPSQLAMALSLASGTRETRTSVRSTEENKKKAPSSHEVWRCPFCARLCVSPRGVSIQISRVSHGSVSSSISLRGSIVPLPSSALRASAAALRPSVVRYYFSPTGGRHHRGVSPHQVHASDLDCPVFRWIVSTMGSGKTHTVALAAALVLGDAGWERCFSGFNGRGAQLGPSHGWNDRLTNGDISGTGVDTSVSKVVVRLALFVVPARVAPQWSAVLRKNAHFFPANAIVKDVNNASSATDAMQVGGGG